jgi:Sec-independent protein translocase protein TatA
MQGETLEDRTMTVGMTQLLVVAGGAVLLLGSRIVPRLVRSFEATRHELGTRSDLAAVGSRAVAEARTAHRPS